MDGGATWSAPVRLSDSAGGADYKTASGFLHPFGDYGEIDVDVQGHKVVVWGEGAGPQPSHGGAWFNRQV